MTTYLVHGFHHQDAKQRVCMLVDPDGPPGSASGSPTAKAQRIAGPEFLFHMSMNLFGVVPDEHKNLLLTEPELYARVPELDRSRQVKRRRRRRS